MLDALHGTHGEAIALLLLLQLLCKEEREV